MDNPQKEDNAVCPYCGNELELATAEIAGLNVCIAWGRCRECGMSSGSKSGATKQEAKRNVLTYLRFPFEKVFLKRRMTIPDLKRAAREIREVCRSKRGCFDPNDPCPFAGYAGGCRLSSDYLVKFWDIDEWEEETNA